MNFGEPGRTRDSAEWRASGSYGETVGIVRVSRPGRAHDDASLLRGDDCLDGVIAHLRDIGWSLLVTYWNGGLDARKLDALPDTVDGILIDGGNIPAPLLQRLAARVPVVMIGRAPDVRGHDVVTEEAVAGQPRRMLGRRACARLIEHIAARGLPPAAELVPGDLAIGASRYMSLSTQPLSWRRVRTSETESQ